MAEILDVIDHHTGTDHKHPVTTKDTDEMLNDIELSVSRGEDDLVAEDEELKMELEVILKTCNSIQTKVGKEVEESNENADDGIPWHT